MWSTVENKIRESGLSIWQAGKKAGLGENTLYEMKSGRIKDMKFSTACKIADALNISLDDLRPKKEEKTDDSRKALAGIHGRNG